MPNLPMIREKISLTFYEDDAELLREYGRTLNINNAIVLRVALKRAIMDLMKRELGWLQNGPNDEECTERQVG